MSNRRSRFTPEARFDLRQIASYSMEAWGERQAEMYVARLDEAFARIAEYPGIGMAMPDSPREARRLTVNQHHVYYLVDDIGVLILRLTHVRGDDAGLYL